jgi:hypothetical protein
MIGENLCEITKHKVKATLGEGIKFKGATVGAGCGAA